MECIIRADNIILDYPKLNAFQNRVNLHYYYADKDLEDKNNLGDFLSKIIVEWMLEKQGIALESKTKVKKHIYAIGSILLMGYQNASIWGTGFPFEPTFLRSLPHRYPLRKLDIRCVRGPYTKRTMERLGHYCPEYYGDPAVLMPLIYQPETSQKEKEEYVIIPHYSTEDVIRHKISDNNIISMNTTNYKEVIDKICAAKKVISSSLHGIILAEAYGIPAIFYQDRPERFNYKYADWYASTGRSDFKCETDLNRAMQISPPMLPGLEFMRKTLLETFPYDLWEN